MMIVATIMAAAMLIATAVGSPLSTALTANLSSIGGAHYTFNACELNCVANGICDPTCKSAFVCTPNDPLVTASGQFGSACYQAVEPPANTQGDGYSFAEANAACTANGGALASVHSDAENEWIYDTLIKGSIGNGNHHYFWIGLVLTRTPVTGTITGSSWTDGSAVGAYENPSSPQTPPWAAGQPDADPANTHTHIYAFGKFKKRWDSYPPTPEEGPSIPSNGYICKACPDNWATFDGHCYKSFSNVANAYTQAQYQQLCQFYGAELVSIHSAAENAFVTALVQADAPVAAFYTGLQPVHVTNLIGSPLSSISWTDSSPVTYGFTLTQAGSPSPPWGVASGPPDNFLDQPDNVGAGGSSPANCGAIWLTLPPTTPQVGAWDDVHCGNLIQGAVCKFSLN
jgi:hypothetical protein